MIGFIIIFIVVFSVTAGAPFWIPFIGSLSAHSQKVAERDKVSIFKAWGKTIRTVIIVVVLLLIIAIVSMCSAF